MHRITLLSLLLAGVAIVGPASLPDRAAGQAAAAPAPANSADRLCAPYSGMPAPSTDPAKPAGMVSLAGGTFLMGSNLHYREEQPPRYATVSGFWIDRTEVTNAQFAAFVAATGYKTVAERGLDAKDFPDLPPEALVPGSMVFFEPPKSVQVRDINDWWRYVPGADWRHPNGPGTSIAGKDNHPVVQVAYADAEAYAKWAGRSLPTEAEWEYAARGGLNGKDFAWGDDQTPDGQWMANSWQGFFPYEDDKEDGYHGTAPVGCFPPNGYGLFDMIGNAWEWASDWYAPGHNFADGDVDPKGPADMTKTVGGPVRVIKGGSWLCAPNYCARYRPSARQPQEADLGASHIGFRTILRAPKPAADKPADKPN